MKVEGKASRRRFYQEVGNIYFRITKLNPAVRTSPFGNLLVQQFILCGVDAFVLIVIN